METKLEIRILPDAIRERERPEISLASDSIHGHLCETALLQVQMPSLRAGVVLSSRRGVQQVTCIICLPVASARNLAAMLHSLSSVNAGLKVKAGLAA